MPPAGARPVDLVETDRGGDAGRAVRPRRLETVHAATAGPAGFSVAVTGAIPAGAMPAVAIPAVAALVGGVQDGGARVLEIKRFIEFHRALVGGVQDGGAHGCTDGEGRIGIAVRRSGSDDPFDDDGSEPARRPAVPAGLDDGFDMDEPQLRRPRVGEPGGA